MKRVNRIIIKPFFNSFLAIGDSCRLLTTFANSLKLCGLPSSTCQYLFCALEDRRVSIVEIYLLTCLGPISLWAEMTRNCSGIVRIDFHCTKFGFMPSTLIKVMP